MLNQKALESQQLNQGQEKLFYENLDVKEEQGDTTNTKFAFPRQCLVLGDPRVGKTSLVKSLTGKPFDPTEQRTQGIDQSLVDHKWKNCDMKDLVFGDLWRFLKTGDVEVALIGTGRQNNKVLVQRTEFTLITSILRLYLYFIILAVTIVFLIGTVYRFPVAFLLFYYIFYGHVTFSFCAFHLESNLRFIFATLAFILNRRGLLIGLYSAIMICLFYRNYLEFAGTREFLMLSTVTGIAFIALFLFIGPLRLPFGTGQLVKNQNFIKFLCFCRLPLSVLIGLISGFIVMMSIWSWYGICFQVASIVPSTTFTTHIHVGQDLETAAIEPSTTSTRHIVIKDHETAHKLNTCITAADQIILSFLSSFVVEFPLHIFELKSFSTVILPAIKEDRSLGSYIVLLIVLSFYYLKIVYQVFISLPLTIFYFFISFPLYICSTLYQEWFCSNLENNTKVFVHPSSNSFLTLALIGNGEMNTTMLRTALKDKYPFLKLKVLDFAGDKEYYAYHHMFLKSKAMYLIVFNMAEFAENYYRDIHVNAERLQFWFESVCSHVPPKTPIILVGTHRENMDKNSMKILNDHLKQILWVPYCDELIVNDDEELIFFAVENSKGENDVGVQKLRIKIMAAAEECKPTTDHDVPLSWIRIQDAIIHLRQKKAAKLCVTLNEFPWAFGNYIYTNWSEETLKYFHEHGLVIYLDKDQDLSNWVLLKPEILVDIIIQLVMPSTQTTQQRGFRSDWQLLQEKGMLTKSLLVSIISKVQENEEAMTAFLEEYDLICSLTNKKVKIVSLSDEEKLQPTHFVPSLLPMSQDGSIPAWHDKITDKRFFVFFKRFLPEPLFHRLLSRAHKNSKMEFPNGPAVLFRDVGKFWMHPWQPYRLKLMKQEGVIEVTFSTR